MRLKSSLLFVSLFFLSFSKLSFAQSQTCNGKFPNPITDYCWSGIFPIKAAGVSLPNSGRSQEDKPGPSLDAFCSCGENVNKQIGVTMSFWEPITMIDVVRKPYCLAGLGGIELGDGNLPDAPSSGREVIDGGGVSKESFYHIHWYANPILYWLGALADTQCLDRSPFDMLDITEVNPTWNDEELSLLTTNPDAYLYANPVAKLACSGDCVSATSGFSNKALYWCAGCQGSMFPLTGKIPNHVGTIQATSLAMQKFINLAHRQLMIWGTSATDGSAEEGLCYKYPKYIMDKTDYKYSMLFPVPERKTDGRCAQPLGRWTGIWGAGHSFPFYGEDVVYMLLRKRDCCEGAIGIGG